MTKALEHQGVTPPPKKKSSKKRTTPEVDCDAVRKRAVAATKKKVSNMRKAKGEGEPPRRSSRTRHNQDKQEDDEDDEQDAKFVCCGRTTAGRANPQQHTCRGCQLPIHTKVLCEKASHIVVNYSSDGATGGVGRRRGRTL
jgi:hypothetical protein